MESRAENKDMQFVVISLKGAFYDEAGGLVGICRCVCVRESTVLKRLFLAFCCIRDRAKEFYFFYYLRKVT